MCIEKTAENYIIVCFWIKFKFKLPDESLLKNLSYFECLLSDELFRLSLALEGHGQKRPLGSACLIYNTQTRLGSSQTKSQIFFILIFNSNEFGRHIIFATYISEIYDF